MRKYATVRFSLGKVVPVHRIDPETARTYCQIENNTEIYRHAGPHPALKKFDVLRNHGPMCKNCERLALAHREGQ